jgi:hypothetical protein
MFVKCYGFDSPVAHLHRNVLPDLEKYKDEGVVNFIKDIKANAEEVHALKKCVRVKVGVRRVWWAT